MSGTQISTSIFEGRGPSKQGLNLTRNKRRVMKGFQISKILAIHLVYIGGQKLARYMGIIDSVMNQPVSWNVIRALNVADMGSYLNDIGGFQKHPEGHDQLYVSWGVKHNRFCFRYLFLSPRFFLFKKQRPDLLSEKKLGGGFKYFLFSPRKCGNHPSCLIFFNWVESTSWLLRFG